MAGMNHTDADDLSTRIVHHDYIPPAGFAALQPGVYKASTVIFPNVAAMRTREWKDKSSYTYGLHGTPTTFTLEERLCMLEGGLQCVLQPSGLAAIANVALALLETGDEVLLPDNVYGPSLALANGELARFGIRHGLYDPLDKADLAARITPATRLVWLEAPGSVTMEFPDLCGQVRICRARGVITALDNTWGAGLAFAPFDLTGDGSRSLGVDISAHALTKFPSGNGDVLMGSVITRDPELHMKIKLTHMRLGLGVAGNDAEAVLRALPSIGLRYRAHDAAARQLALWLQQQPAIAQVLHPALAGSPGHAHWQALCGAGVTEAPCGADTATRGAAAGLFSVIIDARYTQSQVDAFCDGLRLFKIGYSWGGPMSLVVPYHLASMRLRPAPHLKPGTLVRFFIGLEAVPDLQQDLQQALERAFAADGP
ncbi:PLP-dependent transferase [Verminephrobacter eiseniae]|uniref:Cystathionine beta-lyase n=1 Tax=Verminephrobacter eiseniae (strain EF01-2) TaxID=391735 RepID=A1WNC3_VEREI|nr:PLP-dependent transferase [Verminephrobacter eiseniae]ABM59130.1 cystathionine beta-lyase [Verminephrobacter eiseniae EF01-2]MCW5284677.1 cystathionine beta-lyase [Verminephrobacter eiseniae]MCW5302384.1 cystathionine beta-lyase [Verminephrobacter eiseniae]MCW8181037.1 cystathionine beta-lyase [Verminephrobacter eiseniae]MCW8190324.1 cystathionine beta-lyase [Verminephrobacter eiseniae]